MMKAFGGMAAGRDTSLPWGLVNVRSLDVDLLLGFGVLGLCCMTNLEKKLLMLCLLAVWDRSQGRKSEC